MRRMKQSVRSEQIVEALKVAAAVLREGEIPFLLGGSLAAWARGGPAPQNDLDFMLRPDDAEPALQALEASGMSTKRPPEEWLYKAWHGDVLIDLIFSPAGLEMTDDVFDRADWISVEAVRMHVMALDDVLATKLAALNEHALDYSSLLAIARALREQIDWPRLQARTVWSPYAQAFLFLVRELGIAPNHAPAPAERRVRIVEPDVPRPSAHGA